MAFRLALLASVLLVAGVVHSADLTALRNSRSALAGAITGILGDEFLVTRSLHHLPGYGLHMTFQTALEPPTAQSVATSVASLLEALGGTVQGLDAGDWVSVYVDYEDVFGFGLPSNRGANHGVLVRLQPGVPGSLEVWIDGSKQ